MVRMSTHAMRLAAASVILAGAFGAWGTEANAATTTLNGVRDANITGGTVNALSPFSYGLVINVFDNTRAVIEFDTSPLPATAIIDALTFNFREVAVANFTSTVNVLGYPRTGAITPADATAFATQIGSYSAVSLGLGNHSIGLTTSILQSVVGTPQHMGLRLQSGSSDTNTSIGSLEQATFTTPPTLGVTYHLVPEPVSFAALALGSLALFVRRRVRGR